MKQKLITKAIEKLAARYPLYSQENANDPQVIVKFFDPTGSATWLITEADLEKGLLFGYATMDGKTWEFGYASLQEIQSVTCRYGLKIEREAHTKYPQALSNFPEAPFQGFDKMREAATV
jgi:hypothetical protein